MRRTLLFVCCLMLTAPLAVRAAARAAVGASAPAGVEYASVKHEGVEVRLAVAPPTRHWLTRSKSCLRADRTYASRSTRS
jgi:hypothetical protein